MFPQEEKAKCLYKEIDAVALGASFHLLSKEYIWLDVRTEEEYLSGHIPTAINIPHDQVINHLDYLQKYRGHPIAIICKAGRRSALAATYLAEASFPSLYNVIGGMDLWSGPIEV